MTRTPLSTAIVFFFQPAIPSRSHHPIPIHASGPASENRDTHTQARRLSNRQTDTQTHKRTDSDALFGSAICPRAAVGRTCPGHRPHARPSVHSARFRRQGLDQRSAECRPAPPRLAFIQPEWHLAHPKVHRIFSVPGRVH